MISNKPKRFLKRKKERKRKKGSIYDTKRRKKQSNKKFETERRGRGNSLELTLTEPLGSLLHGD
jgi:hypothetical protein